MPMRETRVKRAVAVGTLIGLVAAVTGARLWDPPLVGFLLILSVALIGTFLAVVVSRAADH
jgi:hypothetical protein